MSKVKTQIFFLYKHNYYVDFYPKIQYNVIGGVMEEKALEILNILNEKGYESYIVGGYPRDKLLGYKTNDIGL